MSPSSTSSQHHHDDRAKDSEVEFLKEEPAASKTSSSTIAGTKRKSTDKEEDGMLIYVDDDEDDEVQFLGVQGPSSKKNEEAPTSTIADATTTTKRGSERKKTFACGICLEDQIPARDGYTLSSCHHRFCTPCCLCELIKSMITAPGSAASSSIVCPQNKCTNHLSLLDVQCILRGYPKLLQLYQHEIANTSALEAEARDASSNTRRCPAANCNFLFEYIPGTGAEGRRHFHCPECRSEFCLQCGANGGNVGPAHKGMTCAGRRESLEKEAAERQELEEWKKENSQADQRFRELLAKEKQSGKTMPCPKCNIPITKNGGCPHMYCTSCKTHFNWAGRG